MRILLAHNRYRPEAPSGENDVVDQESAALAARGHEVALFQRHSGDIAGWPKLRQATLPARVVWSTESRRAMAAEIVRFAPDVVHVHNTFPLLTPSILYACRDASVPVVATLHNYKLGCASGDLYRDGAVCHDCLGGSARPALIHGCYRGSRPATLPIVTGATIHARTWSNYVSAFIFVSAAQASLLEPVGLPAERRFVKHNFVPANASPAAAKEHQVAFVGRLDPAKGALFLMRAWDAFRHRRPASRLRLTAAGGGPLAEDFRRWAADRDSVMMAGYVSRTEVSQILGRSLAAVIPSQWEETFGMVAVEAMAAGTAPIATAHGSFPELITPGQDGALFPPTDIEALVDLLSEVDDRPGDWEDIGRRAATTYGRRFTVEAGVNRLLAIYRFAIDYPVTSAGIAGTAGRSSS